MNNKRRELLKTARSMLEQASNIVDRCIDAEQDAMDNLPENLQFSDGYSAMEDSLNSMDDAMSHIESAMDSISNAL